MPEIVVQIFVQWSAGLLVALLAGHFVVDAIYNKVEPKAENPSDSADSNDSRVVKFSPQWMGHIERVFFATAIGIDVSEFTIPAMFAWLTLKMAANWGRAVHKEATEQDLTDRGRRSIKALVCGLISMWFAGLGGLICAGEIPTYKLIFP